ncbi:MAG: PilZ domain-containing protein [Planctomycetota bacterium]|nr:PilZ domain-containing protein [Planctomycetota bacterium]
MTISGALHALAKAHHDERRNSGRLGVEDLRCSAGQIIDLSATGARLRSKKQWEEGQIRRVEIKGSGMVLLIAATCVWVRKEGWRRYVVGLRFDEVNQEQRAFLTQVARRYVARWWDKESSATRAASVSTKLIPLQEQVEKSPPASMQKPTGGPQAEAA